MWTQSCEILNPYEALCEACEKEKNVERRKMTNGDKIRSMTDEELADFFEEFKTHVEPYCRNALSCDLDCNKCCLEWLRQEVEE